MYIIMEENKDLREELDSLRSLTYEQRMKNLVTENDTIKKRNGMLLIQVAEMERELLELSKSKQHDTFEGQKNFVSTVMTQQRPSTSAGAFMRKQDDMKMTSEDMEMMLSQTAQDDFDRELDEMIIRNQQRLAELQNDVK